MKINAAADKWRTSLAWSAVFLAAGFSIFGLVGWLWLFSADGPTWRAVSLGAVLALAAVVGSTWYLSRAHADRRWRAALNRYAERELAKQNGAPFAPKTKAMPGGHGDPLIPPGSFEFPGGPLVGARDVGSRMEKRR